MYKSFREIIDQYASRKVMAEDINSAMAKLSGAGENEARPKITAVMVADWRRRNRIPVEYFDALISCLEARGFHVATFAELAALFNAGRNRAKAQNEELK